MGLIEAFVFACITSTSILAAVGHSNAKSKQKDILSSCPESFDYVADGSCFKYAKDVILTRVEAEQYCENNASNSRLARLNTPKKYRATMKFFSKIFFQEQRIDDATPTTAWTDAVWLPGSTSILYGDVTLNASPKWMPRSRALGNDVITWPTYRFGYTAVCVVASLWQPNMAGLGISEVSGLYNVYCDKLYETHPMCEFEI